jgi:hypothetical protein
LGEYFIYHIRAFSDDLSGCGGVDCVPDFPKAGYDAHAFFITANLILRPFGAGVRAATYVLPKSKLEAGPDFTYVRFDRCCFPLGDFDVDVQPSVPAPGEPLAAANGPTGSTDENGLDRDIVAWFILRPTLTSAPSLTANIVAQGYVVPPNGYSMLNPAFAVNRAGVGVIGVGITNPDPNVAGGFPSALHSILGGSPEATSLSPARARLRMMDLPAVRGPNLADGAIMARLP